MSTRPTSKAFGNKFESLNAITSQLNASAPNPDNRPEIGDTAGYTLADESFFECFYSATGWQRRAIGTLTPSGDVAVPGAVVASNTGVQRHRATWYQNLFPDNQLSVWSAPGTRTILLRIPAPCAFGGFRLRIPSGGNDAVQYSCAVNGAELDNGATWTWTQIPIGGSTAAYTRAAAGGTEWTDWMFMPSVPRLDGGSRPYLFVRCYGAAAVYKAFSVQSAVCQKQNALYGADALAYAAVGDNRLTSLGMTPTYSTSVQLNILGVEWAPVDDKPAYTIGCTGDSIDQGWDRSGGTNLLWQPAAEEACRELIRRGKRCIDFSLPRAGQNHTAAMGDITTLLAQFVPDFHLFSPWSANDTDSEQAFRDCWGRTVAGIKTLQAAGVTPVVRTLHPRGAIGPAELRRTALNDMVRRLRGVIVVDLDAALRDPSNPSVMLPGYEDPAGIDAHLSKAGTARYGVAVADAIEGWIG